MEPIKKDTTLKGTPPPKSKVRAHGRMILTSTELRALAKHSESQSQVRTYALDRTSRGELVIIEPSGRLTIVVGL